MADKKISELALLSTANLDPAVDYLPIVDPSEAAAADQNKRVLASSLTAPSKVLASVSANGVVYVNASSAFTSGTTLQFDGTGLVVAGKGVFGDGSIGTVTISQDGHRLNFSRASVSHINATSIGGYLSFGVNGASENLTISADGDVFAAARLFVAGNTGVGNTSPAEKLHVTVAEGAEGGIRIQGFDADGNAGQVALQFVRGGPSGINPFQYQIRAESTGASGYLSFLRGSDTNTIATATVSELMRLSSTGLTVTGTLSATGNVTLSLGDLVITTPTTPASAADAGVVGTIAWDASYMYVCVATNSWKRVAIAAW